MSFAIWLAGWRPCGYVVYLPNLFYRMLRIIDVDSNRLFDADYEPEKTCMNALNNGYTNARSRINTAALIAFADQDDRVHPRQDRRYGILHGRSPGACRDYGVSGTH